MSQHSPSCNVTGNRALVRLAAYRSISGAWNEPALLACSGGVDSSALVVLASEAFKRGKVAPFVVAYVDHRSRPESSRDAEAVRALCARYGAPFVSLTVADDGAVPGRSTEDLWRERRYRELTRAASALGATVVVTAHTRDDQVETVLMRMLSGSSLGGMQPRSLRGGAILLRPLLNVARVELEEVLRFAAVAPLIDPSNADITFRRNAVRHEVVPALQRVFPGFEGALLRSVELAEANAGYCDREADGVYDRLHEIIPGGVRLDRRLVRGLHPAIGSRVIRRAAIEVLAREEHRELTLERVEAVLAAAAGRTGALIELPYGVRARIERDAIIMLDVTRGDTVD